MDALPSYAELVAEEDELRFDSFTHDDAWALGCVLRDLARERGLPVAMDVSRGEQQLFHAALPGSSADNDAWIQRKIRVVRRCGNGSLAVGQLWRERGTSAEAALHLDPALYAAAGGSFPIGVRNAGPIGTVTVSGLPQLEDHRLAVEAVRRHLGSVAGRA
jgi:uncharacterized protein (UPF0303 family)